MTRLSQAGWRIAACSSEETVNGAQASEYSPASAVIDGRGIATGWHSRWTSQAASYPHFIVIDMGIDQEVHKFSFQHWLNEERQPHRAIKEMDLFISLDGENFDFIDSYKLENTGTPQVFDFPEKKFFRYLKLVGNCSWDGEQFACFAEVSLYRNKSGRAKGPGKSALIFRDTFQTDARITRPCAGRPR
jgi:hypothetical protein